MMIRLAILTQSQTQTGNITHHMIISHMQCVTSVQMYVMQQRSIHTSVNGKFTETHRKVQNRSAAEQRRRETNGTYKMYKQRC